MSEYKAPWRRLAAVALAGLLGSTALAVAKVERRVVVRHPGGSVHFGHRVVVSPVVRPGTIRREYWERRDVVRVPVGRPFLEGRPFHEVFRLPYTWEYVRRFPVGYRLIVVGPYQYYAYPALPPGYQVVVVNGITYYVVGRVYFQPYIYEGQTMYLAVPPP
jgi:hypothetical protein